MRPKRTIEIEQNKAVLLNNDTEMEIPPLSCFTKWIEAVIQFHGDDFQVSIEIVDKTISQELNYTYRNKSKPTNVLSFPLELPDIVEEILIGDLAICAEVVEDEAKQQNKPINDHWAHLTIHGCLHLLGFDHIEDDEAKEMEGIEIKLLKKLGIENPYNSICIDI